KIQFSNKVSNIVRGARFDSMVRNFFEMFLRAQRALEFSHSQDPSRTSTIYFCCDARTWAGWGKPMRRREFITLFGGDPPGHGAHAAAGRAGDRLPRPEITRGTDGPSARISAGP